MQNSMHDGIRASTESDRASFLAWELYKQTRS